MAIVKTGTSLPRLDQPVDRDERLEALTDPHIWPTIVAPDSARSHFVSWLNFRTNATEVWRRSKWEWKWRWSRETTTTTMTASAMQLSVWDFRLLQLQLATHLVATWGFPAGGSGSSNFWRIFGVWIYYEIANLHRDYSNYVAFGRRLAHCPRNVPRGVELRLSAEGVKKVMTKALVMIKIL